MAGYLIVVLRDGRFDSVLYGIWKTVKDAKDQVVKEIEKDKRNKKVYDYQIVYWGSNPI